MAPARTIRQQVTDHIRDEVLSGNFQSGQALRESDVAKRLGVSHGPVRDAFLQLAQEGFLAYQANRGVRVRQPPDRDNREFIVSLRHQIESHLVRRGFDQLFENEHLARIKESLDTLKESCLTEDAAAVARSDMEFHQTILECCGGEDFLPIWKWLCSQMLLTYSQFENYMQIHQEHVTIFVAIQNQKKQATLSAIKANIR